MSVLLTVKPKCMLATLHAALYTQWVCIAHHIKLRKKMCSIKARK